MKKIIALLLALVCVFVFVACGDNQTPDAGDNNDNTGNNNNDNNDNNNDNNNNDDNTPDDSAKEELAKKLEPFKLAIEKTEPATAVVTTSIENALLGAPMTGTWNLTYSDNGTINVEFSYQYMIEDITADSPDTPYAVQTGNAVIDKDGNVTGAEGQFSKVAAAALIKYNLDADKLADAKFGLGVLSAKIAAADTEAVLGVALGADAAITMTVVENVLSSVTVSYSVDGIPATIIASFN